MAIQSPSVLKSFFETGDVPTQSNFADLIDSCVTKSATGTAQLAPTGTVSVGIEQTWNGTVVSHVVERVNPWVGSGHGPFQILVELHQNPVLGTYDFVYEDGVFGGAGIGPTSKRVRETGWRVGGTLESHEIYDTCQHFPGGASGAVNVAAHWPTSRRCGYTYSTFNWNQGSAAGGVITGKINTDDLQVFSDYANPVNPGIGVYGNYFTISPNFQTGQVSAQFRTTTNQQMQFNVSNAGMAIASTVGLTISGTLSVSMQLADNSSSLSITTAGGVGIVSPRWISTSTNFNGTSGVLQFNSNSGTSAVSIFLARASGSGDVEFGVSASTYTAHAPINGNRGFIFNRATQMSFVNANNFDWVFFRGSTECFRVSHLGGIVTPTQTPASASATGTTGQVTWDANFIYVATATDTWKRAAITTW